MGNSNNITAAAQLELYRKAVNKLDDYFEYRSESRRDRELVHEVLAELTAGLLK